MRGSLGGCNNGHGIKLPTSHFWTALMKWAWCKVQSSLLYHPNGLGKVSIITSWVTLQLPNCFYYLQSSRILEKLFCCNVIESSMYFSVIFLFRIKGLILIQNEDKEKKPVCYQHYYIMERQTKDKHFDFLILIAVTSSSPPNRVLGCGIYQI